MFEKYQFEEETLSPEETKIIATISSAMTYINKLMEEAKTQILCGQYESYVKNFVFIKYLVNKLSEMQDKYDKYRQPVEGDGIIRFADIEQQMDDILAQIKTYEDTPTTTKANTKINPNPTPNIGINW